jgi:hypothetical protein
MSSKGPVIFEKASDFLLKLNFSENVFKKPHTSFENVFKKPQNCSKCITGKSLHFSLNV